MGAGLVCSGTGIKQANLAEGARKGRNDAALAKERLRKVVELLGGGWLRLKAAF